MGPLFAIRICLVDDYSCIVYGSVIRDEARVMPCSFRTPFFLTCVDVLMDRRTDISWKFYRNSFGKCSMLICLPVCAFAR